VPQIEDEESDLQPAPEVSEIPEPSDQVMPAACESKPAAVQAAPAPLTVGKTVAARPGTRRYENKGPGINVRRELYDRAGFTRDQQVGSVNLY
ncbi:MAG: hypothetical protein ACM3VT_06210, partial [Solirubrobacterales bacterium]